MYIKNVLLTSCEIPVFFAVKLHRDLLPQTVTEKKRKKRIMDDQFIRFFTFYELIELHK